MKVGLLWWSCFLVTMVVMHVTGYYKNDEWNVANPSYWIFSAVYCAIASSMVVGLYCGVEKK